MNLIRFYLTISQRSLFVVVAAGAFAGAVNVLMLILLNKALSQHADLNGFYLYVAIVFAVAASGFVSSSLVTRFSQAGVFHLRNQLVNTISSASLPAIERNGSARLMMALTEDLDAVSEGAAAIPVILMNMVIVLASVVYLATLSPQLFLITLSVIAVSITVYNAIARNGNAAIEQHRNAQESLQAAYEDLIFGFKDMKQGRRISRFFVDSFFLPYARCAQATKNRATTWFALAESAGKLLFFIFLGSLPYMVPALGNATTSTPPAAGVLFTMMFLLAPISTVIALSPVFRRANVAFHNIRSLALSPEPAYAGGSDVKLAHNDGPIHIRFDQLRFDYPHERVGDSFSLGPLTFEIEEGKAVFIVGGNGSGKSTLAKIMTGLYSPGEGGIYVNGEPLDVGQTASYRELFHAVWADHHLLSTNLSDPNLKRNLVRREIWERLGLQAYFDHFEGISPNKLSTGQKKRLALLYALSTPARFYLFDEWTANQDPEFRDVFYTVIVPQLTRAGHGVVVITHDEKYFHLADELLVLDKGGIAKRPTLQHAPDGMHQVSGAGPAMSAAA